MQGGSQAGISRIGLYLPVLGFLLVKIGTEKTQ